MPPLNNFSRTCIAIAVGHSLLGSNLQAATVTVNSNLDMDASSECTFRYALKTINDQTTGVYNGCTASLTNALGTDDEILFNLPLGQETIVLNGSPLSVTERVNINPDGLKNITIDANNLSRVITVSGNAVAMNINEMTLTGGSTTSRGGGVYINDVLKARISSSIISGNSADDGGGGIYLKDAVSFRIEDSSVSSNGGGVFSRNSENVQIIGTTISDNTMASNGAGIYLGGSGNASITNSVVSRNRVTGGGSAGGGIYLYNSPYLNMLRSQVSDNFAADGGGLYIVSSDYATFDKSTISNNSTLRKGGGLNIFSSDFLAIINSTVSNNSALLDSGGGIYWNASSDFGLIKQSTIFDNSAAQGGGFFSLADMDITNTVIANNTIFDSNGTSSANDCNTDIVDMGVANWISDGTCDGSLASGDPRLGPLKDNGGLTPTHAPKSGSGLAEAGELTICKEILVSEMDQREEMRGTDVCSIGSVEFTDESSIFVVPLAGGKSVIFEL